MTSMIYPTTNPAMSETMVVSRAEGPYIYAKQGQRYLEGMAGLGVGIWKDTEALAKVWKADQRIPSRMGTGPRRRRLKSWQQAVNRAKTAS